MNLLHSIIWLLIFLVSTVKGLNWTESVAYHVEALNNGTKMMSKKRNEGGIDNGKPQGAVSILDDVNPLLSVMEHATKIQQRCAQFGFDWDTFTPVAAKVQEELIEVMEEAQLNNRDQQRVEEELGDLLFAVINLARHLDADPEQALRKANLKFAKRFAQVEQKVINSGKILQDSQLDELDALWQEVKREEKE